MSGGIKRSRPGNATAGSPSRQVGLGRRWRGLTAGARRPRNLLNQLVGHVTCGGCGGGVGMWATVGGGPFVASEWRVTPDLPPQEASSRLLLKHSGPDYQHEEPSTRFVD